MTQSLQKERLPLWISWQRIHLQCRRPGFDPELGRFPGEGKDYPLQYYGLENSMHCSPWGCKESNTFTFTLPKEVKISQFCHNFMSAITICSVFRALENSLSLFPLFPHLFAMKWWMVLASLSGPDNSLLPCGGFCGSECGAGLGTLPDAGRTTGARKTRCEPVSYALCSFIL